MKMFYILTTEIYTAGNAVASTKDLVSSTNKMQRYENKWKGKLWSRGTWDISTNSQGVELIWILIQTVKIYTYLTSEIIENLNNGWIFNNSKKLLLTFLKCYNSMVAKKIFTDDIICLDLLPNTTDKANVGGRINLVLAKNW